MSFDRAAVEFHDLAHDGDAQAEAFVASGAGAVRTAEVVEDVRQKLGVDAHAVVVAALMKARG